MKTDAIEFIEWVHNNYWIRDPFPNKHTGKYMWVQYSGEPKQEITIEQLYQLFKKN